MYQLINQHYEAVLREIGRNDDVSRYVRLLTELRAGRTDAVATAGYQALYRSYWRMNMARLGLTAYVRPGARLRTAGALIEELCKTEPTSGKLYWARAAQRGSRIGKFVRVRRSIAKWARILNEPSHFSIANRRLNDSELRQFVRTARGWFDEKDKNILVAIVNQIVSRGKYTAVLGPEPTNIPGIQQRVVVTGADLKRTPEGGLTLGVEVPHLIVSKRQAPRGRWPRLPVLIESTGDISIGVQLVTKRGHPVRVGTLRDIIESLASTQGERAYLVRRMRELGLTLQFRRERTNGGT